MKPRPPWLRVVDGGAAPRPSERLSPRPSAAPLRRSLPDAEPPDVVPQSPRWVMSPLTRWAPALLGCSMLSGLMAWDLGRLWIQRSEPSATTLAARQTMPGASDKAGMPGPRKAGPDQGVAATPAPRPEVKRPPEVPAPRLEVAEVPPEAMEATPDPLDALALLACLPAGLTANDPPSPPAPTPAPLEPRSTRGVQAQASRPGNPTPTGGPAVETMETPRPIPPGAPRRAAGRSILADAERVIVDLEVPGEAFESLPAEVRDEVRQAMRDALQTRIPARISADAADAADAMESDEHLPIVETPDGARRIILYQEGGTMRVRTQKLAAPAQPVS